MYKQIFNAIVPYRKPDDPTLLPGPFGKSATPNLAYFTTPPRIYGEQFLYVNAMLMKKEETANSPTTITINVMTRNIYWPSIAQTIKFDAATGEIIGYGDMIGTGLEKEIVQSRDGSLWTTIDDLRELDPATNQVIQTIPAEFFEIPTDQEFHGIVHPMVDRPRGLIVMAGYPASSNSPYVLVNDLKTGALIRRIWVSGPVSQIMQEDDRRCFVICSNGIINVVDYTIGKVISATRAPVSGVHTPFGVTYAWDFALRRLLAFDLVDDSFGPPINPDGSSSNTISGYYPVPIATNITKPIPLKPPRKGRTVPMLVRAVGDAGEAIPSLPITITATAPGAIGTGARITDNFGYATINLIGTDAGLSEVTVNANVDDGSTGTGSGTGGGGTGGDTGGGTGGGSGTGSVAPSLSLAAAMQTGSSTAAGTVSTNQDNGLLYTLVSTSETATAPEVKAGQVQSVTTSGTQNVVISSLTAGTAYYPHYLHRNSAGLDSEVATGAIFTTAADGSGAGTGTGGGQSSDPIVVGSQIAPLSVQNTLASAATNQPFAIGHVFAKGHLPNSGAAITLNLADGSQISAQLNVKATHADGSVRHAMVSGVIPSIAAGATVALSMKRANPASAGQNVGLPASLPSAKLVIGGVQYIAAPTGATPYITWFAGPVASDFVFNMPFVDGSGTPHPTLTAQFSVRAFATGHVRVDYVIEHCKAYKSIADITYDATLYAAGQSVYTRTGLVHTPAARWKRTFWVGASPSLHIRHDKTYLIASKAVPNYDQRITISESLLASYATAMGNGKFVPMGFGTLMAAMGTTGGRPDIGIMPDTHAALVLSMDKRAKDIALGNADIGGTWPACRRDDSTGPGAGYPLSVINFPYATVLGGSSDGINPTTGKNEHLPTLSTATQAGWDSSHQPGIFYLPYLLTGDYYYLEGLHFWCMANIYQSNPNYRNKGQGLIEPDQVRGQGWSIRTLAECAYVTPDDHPLKSSFDYFVGTNFSWYNQHYTDGTNNVLGIITGSAFAYNNGRGMAPWQDDFFTQSLNHAVELLDNDAAKRLLMWKSKFQVSRFLGSGTCIMDAANYDLNCRDSSTSPYYTTIGQCMAATIPTSMSQYACNSPQRLATASSPNLQPGDLDGYPDSTEGYPANLQPALAAAVDVSYPQAANAWSMFDARPTKPDYSTGPQFAIVPR